MEIVEAKPEHLPAISRIYDAVVVGSAATFDLEPPPLSYWERALESVDREAGHLLIVGLDDGGEVLGYAKSGRFRERAAYDTTCETSIYVAEEARGRGVGRAIYGRLIELLEGSRARLAVGGMADAEPGQRRPARVARLHPRRHLHRRRGQVRRALGRDLVRAPAGQAVARGCALK